MPQLFQVLKCFKCSVFQVHQTKKSNKWECKLCGEKQSMKRHYGLGTGKECRLHVQKLNGVREQLDEINETTKLNESSDEDNQLENDPKVTGMKLPNNASKWSDFVDKDVIEPVKEPNKPMYLGNSEVVLEVPTKKRKFSKPKNVSNANPSHSKDFNHFSHKRKSPSPPIILYETIVPVKPENNILGTDECKFVNAKEANSRKPDKRIDKKFAVQKVNKNSKWAQYAYDEEDNCDDENCETNNEDEEEPNGVNLKEGKFGNTDKELPKSIFELCDDNDLDELLDF